MLSRFAPNDIVPLRQLFIKLIHFCLLETYHYNFLKISCKRYKFTDKECKWLTINKLRRIYDKVIYSKYEIKEEFKTLSFNYVLLHKKDTKLYLVILNRYIITRIGRDFYFYLSLIL